MAVPGVLPPPSAAPSSSRPRRPRALLLGLGAGLVAGLIFNAASLGFRHVVGAPSFPEDVSDLTVPFIPASVAGDPGTLVALEMNGARLPTGTATRPGSWSPATTARRT
jgi:hypothetical protein